MLKADEELRQQLIETQSLADSYNEEMEKVHIANAHILEKIIDIHGWPTAELVGEEASHAAWIIAQHAISLPNFQRKVLHLLKSSKEKSIKKFEIAMLEDRILYFEGKKQLYGTQFDWDENNEMSPLPILDPETVEKRRKIAGLPTLEQSIIAQRQQVLENNEKPPKNKQQKEEQFQKWLKKVGWRD